MDLESAGSHLLMKGDLRFFSLLLLLLVAAASAQLVQIKDVAHWQKAVANPVVGYGLVVGLNQTGDTLIVKSTNQTITNMLKNFGVFVTPDQIRMRNVAAVMVTADLPPFSQPGERIDVMASSMGDASSLEGGTLLLTPLFGADGEIYVEAQGPVSIGGFNEGIQGGTRIKKNHPNAGWVPGGGLITKAAPEGEVASPVKLVLERSDFSLAQSVVSAIDKRFGAGTAKTVNAREIAVAVPEAFASQPVAFMAELEKLSVQAPISNKVVVNEKTGTVVIGGGVRISAVAIAHGNLQVTIKPKPVASQPAPLSPGTTQVLPRTKVKVQEEKANLFVVNETATVQDLTLALNRLGVTPRDLIAILQGLKRAGAMQADIVIW